MYAEKARTTEEETRLLRQKASEAESEIQRVKVAVLKVSLFILHDRYTQSPYGRKTFRSTYTNLAITKICGIINASKERRMPPKDTDNGIH